MITLREPDFCQELFADEASITPLSRLGTKSVREVLMDNSIPKVLFSATVWREIRYMAETILPNSEFAIYCLCKQASELHGVWLVHDFFIPKQKASSAGVSIDAQDARITFSELEEVPYYANGTLQRFVLHLHSHANFDTFWSSIDLEQQTSRDDLGYMDDYRFYTVINNKLNILTTMVNYSPLYSRINAFTGIYTGREEYSRELTKERREELKCITTDKVYQNIINPYINNLPIQPKFNINIQPKEETVSTNTLITIDEFHERAALFEHKGEPDDQLYVNDSGQLLLGEEVIGKIYDEFVEEVFNA